MQECAPRPHAGGAGSEGCPRAWSPSITLLKCRRNVVRVCAPIVIVLGWMTTVGAAIIDDFMITSGTASIPSHTDTVSGGSSSAYAVASLVGNYIFNSRSVSLGDLTTGDQYTNFVVNSFSFPSGAGMARIDQGISATVVGGGRQSMIVTYANTDGHPVDLSGVDSFQLTRSNPFDSGGGPSWGGSGTWLRFSVVTSSGEYIARLEDTVSTEFVSGVADLALTDFTLNGSWNGAHLSSAVLSSVTSVRLLQDSSADSGPLASGSGYKTVDLTSIRALPEPIVNGPAAVPEIDPSGLGQAGAILAGLIGLIEVRRVRRPASRPPAARRDSGSNQPA